MVVFIALLIGLFFFFPSTSLFPFVTYGLLIAADAIIEAEHEGVTSSLMHQLYLTCLEQCPNVKSGRTSCLVPLFHSYLRSLRHLHTHTWAPCFLSTLVLTAFKAKLAPRLNCEISIGDPLLTQEEQRKGWNSFQFKPARQKPSLLSLFQTQVIRKVFRPDSVVKTERWQEIARKITMSTESCCFPAALVSPVWVGLTGIRKVPIVCAHKRWYLTGWARLCCLACWWKSDPEAVEEWRGLNGLWRCDRAPPVSPPARWVVWSTKEGLEWDGTH